MSGQNRKKRKTAVRTPGARMATRKMQRTARENLQRRMEQKKLRKAVRRGISVLERKTAVFEKRAAEKMLPPGGFRETRMRPEATLRRGAADSIGIVRAVFAVRTTRMLFMEEILRENRYRLRR